jgi:hypothetical protein
MRLRIAEINENAVAHVFGDKAVEMAHGIGGGAVIRGDDLAQILRIELRRQRGRADQIAEHYRQLAAFSIGSYGYRGEGHLRRERADGIEQPPAVPNQADAEILQILGRQARQHPCVDLVRAERRLVLLEPELPQPIPTSIADTRQ